MQVVSVRPRIEEVFRDKLDGLVGLITREIAGKPLRTAIGFSLLSDIGLNFTANAAIPVGGPTPDVDMKWPPLSPKTIAARRFGPGEEARLRRDAGVGRKGDGRGVLTKLQEAEWKKRYQGIVKWLITDLGYSLRNAKVVASKSAWAHVRTKHNAKTVVEVFGTRRVEILRDTGIMGNSISAGVLRPDGNYTGPTDPGGENQVFEVNPSNIVLGTVDFKAGFHHFGTSRIPQRKLWPDPEEWPQEWWDNVKESMLLVFPHVIRLLGR